MGFLADTDTYVDTPLPVPGQRPPCRHLYGTHAVLPPPLAEPALFIVAQLPHVRAHLASPLPPPYAAGHARHASPPLTSDTHYLHAAYGPRRHSAPDEHARPPWAASTLPPREALPPTLQPASRVAYGPQTPPQRPHATGTGPQAWRPPLPWHGPPGFACPPPEAVQPHARQTAPPLIYAPDARSFAPLAARDASAPPPEIRRPGACFSTDPHLLQRQPDTNWLGARGRAFYAPPPELRRPEASGQIATIAYWGGVEGGEATGRVWLASAARHFHAPPPVTAPVGVFASGALAVNWREMSALAGLPWLGGVTRPPGEENGERGHASALPRERSLIPPDRPPLGQTATMPPTVDNRGGPHDGGRHPWRANM